MSIDLHHGDCLDIMPTLEAESVDSIVTDPPYGLGFMGKDWDHGVPGEAFWVEALRVARPGAYLLAFGGTRMVHRLAVAIEDAGWEIRDRIHWCYGSGFPKSHNLKGKKTGWGTALKPAVEPIIMARKPLSEKTVAANVMEHGTGAINVDGCRVGTEDNLNGGAYSPSKNGMSQNDVYGKYYKKPGEYTQPSGRWPANLIHDGSDEVVGLFPVTGSSKAASRGLQHSGRHGGLADIGGNIKEGTDTVRGHNDNGGSAARFFYCAKASKLDRDEGCEGLESKNNMRVNGPRESEEAKHATKRNNHHPTVKPTDLMRYLCRLVTPPGGVVLDPFTGSGSTGKAARLEGFNFIGIEKDADYFAIASKRINQHGGLFNPPNPSP